MSCRYTFGGDEHIFVEVSDAMSLEAFFVSLAITNAVRDARIDGVTEICPANASFQIKFDPDQIADMLHCPGGGPCGRRLRPSASRSGNGRYFAGG